MTTWSTLFAGSNVYSDVLSVHPNLYTEAVSDGGAFELYNQFIVSIPGEISLLFGIFYNSILPPLLLITLAFSLFMPIIRKAQIW